MTTPTLPVPSPPLYSWVPKTAGQKAALDSEADLLFFGGSAGSLKTATLCADAVQEHMVPDLRGLLIRRTFPELQDIIDKTHRMYIPLGGVYNEQKKFWKFPSGAQIRLGYLESDRDVYLYWGNEFSFIGIDESTMQTEFRIRTLISRLRSTSPYVKKRVRLGSNPGGIGASFHQEIFLHGHCPVHEREKSAVPGKLYYDRKWPSDGTLIPMSVAFIPGNVHDHTLLGDNYVELLRMQQGSLSAALELGCWCELESAYFNFLNRSLIRPYAEIGEQWWHTHFLSIDYGYGKSSAAAGLYSRGVPEPPRYPQGRIHKIAELVIGHTAAYEFARMVAEQLILPHLDGQRRKIVIGYLDPANFKDIGDGHTIANQIAEVLAPHEIMLTPASNDRVGGWQLIYRLLRTGEFEICDTCPKTFEALRTRTHDEKKFGDVLKVPGDELDDLCLIAGTLVETERGSVPIEQVRAGERVWTRDGLRSVTRAWMTKANADVLTVELSDGTSLTGTASHPVLANGRFVRLDELRYGDNLLSWRDQKPSSSTASSSDAIPTPDSGRIASTTALADQIERAASASCIRKSGRRLTALFQRGITSTIAAAIRWTTAWKIWNACLSSSTCGSTLSWASPCRNSLSIWSASGLWPLNGTAAQKARSGIRSTRRKPTASASSARIGASAAAATTPHGTSALCASVPALAKRNGGGIKGWTTSAASALFAALRSWKTDSPVPSPAPVRVARISAGKSADVFNLTIDGSHEFFANGVLVHNCDETRYAIYSFINAAEKPREIEIAERMQGLDPTNAMMTRLKILSETSAENAPVFTSPSAQRRYQQRSRRSY